MRQAILLSLFLLLGIISCNQESDKILPKPLDTTISFNSENNYYENKEIELNLQLGANKNGDTLILQIDITNESKDTVQITTTEIQLTNTFNLRCNVIPADYQLDAVGPKSSSSITVRFNPVNNLYLYKKSGIEGAVDSLYILKGDLCFVNSESVINLDVAFKLDDRTYEKFNQQRQNEANATYFVIDNDKEIQTTISKQLSRLVLPDENHEGHNHGSSEVSEAKHVPSILIMETEMMIQGLVFKLNFFQIDSLLKLNARIINHGKFDLEIDTSLLSIQIGNEKIKLTPTNIYTTAPQNTTGHYKVRKSGRFAFSTSNNVGEISSFKLNPEGFKYSAINEKVFLSLIRYKPEQGLN